MKMQLSNTITALAATLALASPLAASAAAYTVPDHFSTIQEAVNASADGDTIYVRPGVYLENLYIENKSLTIQSLKGAAQTVIDGRRLGATVTVARGGQVDIDGFTIQNGAGAGVWYRLPNGSYPSGTVSNSVIVNNDFGVSADGAGASGHTHVTVRKSVVANNANSGVYVHMSCAYVYDSVITNNHAVNGGGVYVYHDAYIDIGNTFITGNRADVNGGGVESVVGYYGDTRIVNSVIDQNTAGGAGGGIHFTAGYSRFYLEGSTVTGNTAPVGGGLALAASSSPFTAVNSIIWGNSTPPALSYPDQVTFTTSDVEGGVPPGVGNISADPLFVSTAGRNYQLFAASPAVNAGSAVNGGVDLLGVTRPKGPAFDMGAYEWTEMIPPVSTATVTGVVGAGGIYTSPATVTITAEDLSGVREIHYVVNGAETVISGPTATFALSADGAYDVSWWSVDAYANVEAAKALPRIQVDVTAPTVASSSPANGAIGVARTATIVVTFSEAVSAGPAFAAVALTKGTTPVAVTKTISGNQLSLRPSTSLSGATVYTVTLPAGAVVDAAGTPTATATTLRFTTK